ncbi:DUF1566 domain-containing protein [Desulfopila sp. IMCC35008]|uniref:Lcl C-terminal domain-containing protein n=1 Tax=Desulfopila sp. IMCC35008 TaxID=2653858 RepID=UPI0013D341FB|nr:DUF1566 domain-containing protein [Desulfopila sp. IMCC35008]
MNSSHILSTGLKRCYNEKGDVIECRDSGQDAEFLTSIDWPAERFETTCDYLVVDRATGLTWTKNSCPSGYPLSWQEGLEFVEQMNKEVRYGRNDWRMPNRREMRSLIDHSSKKPALTRGHPFKNIFLGWFWTSTTAAIATRYAWYVHLEGGRMFYGNKDGYYWLWPVCGHSDILACTGAEQCYDERGSVMSCDESKQDASLLTGIAWPRPRFTQSEFGVSDELTGLTWHAHGSLGKVTTTWIEALTTVGCYAQETGLPWRLPTINELESLVDASSHSPALPPEHPFSDIQQSYWSSTTSSFATDWAYVLYLVKGAVGVGYKKNSDFALWPVLSMEIP